MSLFLTAAVSRMSQRLFLARLGKNRVVSSGSSQSRCIIGRVWKRGWRKEGGLFFLYVGLFFFFLIEAQTEQEMQIILDGRMHSDVMALQLELLVARTT